MAVAVVAAHHHTRVVVVVVVFVHHHHPSISVSASLCVFLCVPLLKKIFCRFGKETKTERGSDV